MFGLYADKLTVNPEFRRWVACQIFEILCYYIMLTLIEISITQIDTSGDHNTMIITVGEWKLMEHTLYLNNYIIGKGRVVLN